MSDHGTGQPDEVSLIVDTQPGGPLLFYVPETGRGACDYVDGGTPAMDGGMILVDPAVKDCAPIPAIIHPDTAGCIPGVCP